MFIRRSKNSILKATAAGALTVAALGLAGCATSGPEEGVDVEDITEDEPVVEDEGEDVGDPYDGPYDSTFFDAYDGYLGETVTVSADVNEVLSPNAFTIAGTDETTVEALLIVHDGSTEGIEEGLSIQVTGQVQDAFDVVTVEEALEVDLDDDLFVDWEDQRYIQADSIDTSFAIDE